MVANAGVDAIGLVFYPPSKRNISIAQAQQICRKIPAFTSVVGLFVNAEKQWVDQVLGAVPLNLLQFHGSEDRDYCEQFGRPYIKALPVTADVDTLALAGEHPRARGFLLDAVYEGAFGGTGKTFDWNLVPEDLRQQVILAGGLHPQNVQAGIQATGAIAVDVSSGVESAPGIKDAALVAAFVKAARESA